MWLENIRRASWKRILAPSSSHETISLIFNPSYFEVTPLDGGETAATLCSAISNNMVRWAAPWRMKCHYDVQRLKSVWGNHRHGKCAITALRYQLFYVMARFSTPLKPSVFFFLSLSFIHSFTHSFIHWLIESFIYSLIRSFIHSFIYASACWIDRVNHLFFILPPSTYRVFHEFFYFCPAAPFFQPSAFTLCSMYQMCVTQSTMLPSLAHLDPRWQSTQVPFFFFLEGTTPATEQSDPRHRTSFLEKSYVFLFLSAPLCDTIVCSVSQHSRFFFFRSTNTGHI